MKIWVVGQFKATHQAGSVWELQGVFDSEEKALKACRKENYVIMPEEMNKELSDETFIGNGSYYPLLQEKPVQG